MKKDIIINLIIKRVETGEKLLDVLADFNITNKSQGIYKCDICGQAIEPSEHLTFNNEIHYHLYCNIPF